MIVKWITIVFLTAVAYGCEDGMELHDLPRRARNYVLEDSEPLVSDYFLTEGWYNATDPSGHYMMPDSSTVPESDDCGTYIQIYIKGSHPKVLSERPVAAVACSRTLSADCNPTYDIKIRNCSGSLQYFLLPTDWYSAYCFDPPSVQGKTSTSISPAPKNFVPGTITVTPVLLWTRVKDTNGLIYNTPTLVFKCSFTRNDVLLYKVLWYVNGHHRLSFGPTSDTAKLDLSTVKLVELGLHLGINVLNPILRFTKSNETAVVKLKTTIPIGCRYTDGSIEDCERMKLNVHLSKQNIPAHNCTHNDVLLLKSCSTGIDLQTNMSRWTASDVFEFEVTHKFTNIEPDTYMLDLQTQESFRDTLSGDFFSGQQLQTITVSSSKYPQVAFCYSHVDPHMRTFHRTYYESQDEGDYVLYRNKRYGIQVQERTRPCFYPGRPMCTCSVAVQAGADVFVINRCHNTTKLNEFVLCNDGGTLDVVKNNEKSYTINTPTGTVIKIYLFTSKSYRGFMNIDIYASPKDLKNTEGLCGYYDDNSGNDIIKRDGTVVHIDQPGRKNTDFTNSWRLLETENLFNRTNLEKLPKWDATNKLMCVCEKRSPICGRSQSTGCFKPKSITNKKCAKVVPSTKRSVSRKINNIWLLSLLQPLVEVAHTNREKRREERSVSENQLTDEDVIGKCTQLINDSPAEVEFPERVEEGEITSLIDQCVFDVKAANDFSVGYTHAESLNEVVQHMFSYEPTFAKNISESITVFLRQTCLNNCSNRGYCSDDGECVCDRQYHDPDCSLYVGDLIHIIVLPDEGICDTTIGDCRCSWFYTENLLDNFTCKLIKTQVDIMGKKTLTEEQFVPGDFDDRFTGQCCWDDSRERKSTDENVLGFEMEMYISNDGATFGNGQTLYVIDETCVEVVRNTSVGDTSFSLKTGFCNIDGRCYADSVSLVSDPCRSCRTGLDMYNWTYVCETSPDVSNSDTVIIAVCVSAAIILIIVVVVAIYFCNKPRSFGIYEFHKRHEGHVNAGAKSNGEANNYYTNPVARFNAINSNDTEHIYDELFHGTVPTVQRDGVKGYIKDEADDSPMPERGERPQTAESIR